MGYTTDFDGEFQLSKALSDEQSAYLYKFAEIRHIGRPVAATSKLPDPLREAVGLPIGIESAYYVGGGRCDTGNIPPKGQPGLWCQWIPTEDGKGICWDEGEKFYDYVAWLQYIIDNFLEPWGIKLSGKVRFQGEEPDDRGAIIISKQGKVTAKEDKIIRA